MNCGRDVVYVTHGLCATCYSAVWRLTRKKTAKERHQYHLRLLLFGRRVEAVDKGLIRIQHAKKERSR